MRGWQTLAVALILAPALSGCTLDGLVNSERVLPAAAFLRAQPFPELVVEVDYVEGHRPSDEALRVLEETLRNVTAKRSVRVLEPEVMDPLPATYPVEALLEAHARTLSSRDAGDDDSAFRGARADDAHGFVVLHVLSVNGEVEDGKVRLGAAWPHAPAAPVVLFGEALRSVHPVGAPNPTYEKVERATLVHEAGHVLGLVNHGAPMVHAREDPEHPKHSRYQESVMYYAADTRQAMLELIRDNGFVPYKFDAYDLQDLAAVREGRAEATRPG